MVEIDGSYLEGGGQILRTAVSLSVVTQKPCHVFNIRKRRPKPGGLAHQHLLGIRALAEFCNGKLEGDYLGSQEIKFYPGNIYRERFSVNILTAASITLLLQALIPPALFAPSPVKITFDGGATDTFFSPTIDYFRYVFLEILKKMGARIEVNIQQRGYYPEGGAKVEIKILPYLNHGGVKVDRLKSISLTERGRLVKILAISGASQILKDKKVAERQLAGVREILGKLKLPIEEKVQYHPSSCPGSHICLIALFENAVIGVDNLGKLGKRAEDVGREAALKLLKEQKSEACFDKYMTDQILPYLALSSKKNRVTVSEATHHFETNISTIEKFVNGKFEVKDNLIVWQP